MFATVLAALVSAAPQYTAFAQAADESGGGLMEEITVSATRRDVTAQKVPVTLDVVTGAQLERSGTIDVRDIFRSAPNVNYTQFRSTEPTLFVRGIGSVFNSMGIDRPVGFYVDDVYLGRAAGALNELVALERVEVLKGPQGTLFGRNTTGGAISYITKNPSEETEYDISAGFGNYGDQRLKAYVTGELSDGLSANLAIGYHKRDGYAENLTTGDDLEDEDAISVRAKLRFDLGGGDLIVGADYFERDAAGLARVPVTGGDGTQPPVPALSPPRDHTHTDGFGSGAAKLRTWGVNSTFTADVGFGDVTWITAYRNMNSFEFQELFADLPGLTQSFINHNPTSSQFSSELRFSGQTDSWDWIAGAFFFTEAVHDVGNQTRFTRSYDSRIDNDSIAVFFDGFYSLSDRARVGVGVRVTDDRRQMDWQACLCLDPLDQDKASFKGDWTEPTGRLLIEYDLNDDVYTFASYTRGYKAGGFNSQATSANLIRVIDPENVNALEAGLKGDFLDNRLRFNITAFWAKVEDVQISALEDEVTGLVVTDNFGEVTTQGIETELRFLPADWLQFSLAYGYTDAEYTGSAIVGGTDIKGLQVNRVPENTLSAGIDFDHQFDGGAYLNGRLAWAWTDEIRVRLSDVPRQDIGDWNKLDASVGFGRDGSPWEFRVWGQNLTDEDIIQHIAFGGPSGVYAPPRTYGLTITLRSN